MLCYLIYALLLILAKKAFCDDKIVDLPGLNFQLNFKHYSGYFNTSSSHKLHYWLNGGPGCSSLEGLLQELGPYFINDDGATLRPNPNAWNKFANVLFLESSAVVGFSYSVDGNVTTNDDQTAQENYIAIQQFLKKFPAFTSNPVFITGESYAGIYVPTLVSLILDGQDNHHINLQGMAIGNGVANNELDVTTKLEFFYYHGIIDEADWQLFLAKCCDGNVGKCKISDFEQPKCDLVNGFLEDQPDYNPYDIYRKCESSTEKTAARSAKYRSRNLTSKMSWEVAAATVSHVLMILLLLPT